MYGKSLRGGLLLHGHRVAARPISPARSPVSSGQLLRTGFARVLDMARDERAKPSRGVRSRAPQRSVRALPRRGRRTRPEALEPDPDRPDAASSYSCSPSSTASEPRMKASSYSEATNQPWEVDAALRRPGRFDPPCSSLPPDQAARERILEVHLRDRPVDDVDVKKLAPTTDGYSGADLSLVRGATDRDRRLLENGPWPDHHERPTEVGEGDRAQHQRGSISRASS